MDREMCKAAPSSQNHLQHARDFPVTGNTGDGRGNERVQNEKMSLSFGENKLWLKGSTEVGRWWTDTCTEVVCIQAQVITLLYRYRPFISKYFCFSVSPPLNMHFLCCYTSCLNKLHCVVLLRHTIPVCWSLLNSFQWTGQIKYICNFLSGMHCTKTMDIWTGRTALPHWKWGTISVQMAWLDGSRPNFICSIEQTVLSKLQSIQKRKIQKAA